MSFMSYDTLKLARKLEASGFTQEQAFGAAEAIAETQEDNLENTATKQDVKDLRGEIVELRHDVIQQGKDLRAEMREMRLEFQSPIKDQTIQLGGMIITLGGILIAIKFFG